MNTQQTTWIGYNGSDKQIAQLRACKNGWIFRLVKDGIVCESYINRVITSNYDDGSTITHYWIIPDDPLREMKIRQAMTSQPVWWRSIEGGGTGSCHENFPPFAHPDEFEYSFTDFEEEA